MRKVAVKNLWHGLARWFSNPMLAKELSSQTRGWRSPLTMTAYLGVLGAVGLADYLIVTAPMRMNGYMDTMVGMRIYVLLAAFQVILIGFMTPALTAGAISGERERQTLDLLLCTRLSAGRIIVGKLLASIGFEMLLIGASLPMFALVFLFGGVAPLDLAKSFGIYLLTAVTFGAIGVFFSAVFRRTQIATVVTYGVVFFLIFGTIVGGVVLARGGYSPKYGYGYPYGNGQFSWIYYSNPLVALMQVMPGNAAQFIPYLPQVVRVSAVSSKMSLAYPGPYPPAPLGPKVSPLLGHLAFDAAVILFCLMMAAYLVKPVHRRRSWRTVLSVAIATARSLRNPRLGRSNRPGSKAAGGAAS